MARIHMPRQRQSDKRWDFTVSSDEEGWAHPTGYCAGFTHPDESDASAEKHGWPKMRQDERDRVLAHRANYHKDGHATSEEAAACHENYELDFELHFETDESTMKKCAVCGEFTTGRARLGQFWRYDLCPTHQTRDDVKTLRQAEKDKYAKDRG